MSEFFHHLLQLSLEAAPWLLLGLVIGGMLKAWLPMDLLQRHLGGKGFLPVIKAALLGAPLPLCSCGVIPAALGLRRAGASKQATVSFLVSTPETGVDSVSISYAMLGPVMAIARPIAAIASALLAGFLVGRTDDIPQSNMQAASTSRDSESGRNVDAHCCDERASPCCDSGTAKKEAATPTWIQKSINGISDTFTQLFNDILGWLMVGLIFAALVQTYLPPTFLAQWGSGLTAMLVMAIVGIPIYVCATASTPIAAGLMLAGISPGTALVFLLAGPATNIATLGIVGKELGKRPLIAYLSGVLITAIAGGLLLDYIIVAMGIDIQAQLSSEHEMIPAWVAWSSLLFLLAVGMKPPLERTLKNIKRGG